MTALTPEVQAEVLRVARAIELSDIRVVGFGARLLGMSPSAEVGAALSVDAEVASAATERGFVIEGRFALEARSKAEPEAPPFLELEYRAGAVYSMAEPAPAASVLEAFGQTNGMMHLWPYFRAFVQQACAQLGIPHIVLPPFRPVTKKEAEVARASSSSPA